jgi:uncharacterized protein
MVRGHDEENDRTRQEEVIRKTQNQMSRKNEIALVTGATSGIGAAFAKKLAALGYDLIITGRRKEIINALAEEIVKNSSVKVEVVIAELADDNELESLARKAAAAENIDMLVNNAGFSTINLFHEETYASQEQMVRVHVLASMRLIHAVLPNMLKRKKGAIINVSSVRAFAAGKYATTYSGTKALLNRFSESLQIELLESGIKVQALCPGFTRTDFHKKIGIETSSINQGLARWMTAEKVVDISLEHLQNGKVICIPGFWNKVLATIPAIVPASLYYKFAPGIGGKK